jgi:aryl-alcohol dehydrogenase-like predicted oxidoreductase
MRYRMLGDSGLAVSELALGTMVFGEAKARGADADTADRMIRRYLEAGGNFVDTAAVYAGGRSEEILGLALRGRRDEVVLATKVRFSVGDHPNEIGLSRLAIMRATEGCLRRLQTETIDLLYMHSWDSLTPIEESLRAFDDLVAQGKVRYIGVSNFAAWQLMKALARSETAGWARFIAAQYQYSLVVRDIEREFVDLCLSEGVGIVPWGPLGGGFLSGKYRPDQRPADPDEGRLATQPDGDEEAWHRRATEHNWQIIAVAAEVAGELGCSVPQVALAWLLGRPAVASVLLGVRTMEQLDDNLGAAAVVLPPEARARLDEVSDSDPGYPYRFLKLYGQRSLP